MNKKLLNKTFYLFKPLIPRRTQIWARRKAIESKMKRFESIWPINYAASKKPSWWKGWPEGKRFAVILTHDVEHQHGHDKSLQLMSLEKKLGFVSSFNFVPERYNVSRSLRNEITANGFEVGVHGLKHDGKLYKNKIIFSERAKKINEYLKDWGAVGFRSPSMHHNFEWLHELNILYDASSFDTDPYEPQSDGVTTIFPFWITNKIGNSYVELPYTLPQDFTLFILMGEKDPSLWQRKLDWIVENGGMALVNVHPDYINFENNEDELEEFPVRIYEDFLQYIKDNYSGEYWNPLPKDLAEYVNEIKNETENLKNIKVEQPA